MAAIRKIKIEDSDELRSVLDALYESVSQRTLARWALKLAAHALEMTGHSIQAFDAVLRGFAVNEAWQMKRMRSHDVRQAGFQIHKLAANCDDTLLSAALRVAGHAVGTGHMREHAMVASDYAVKAVNILFPGNRIAVLEEREWQIVTMKQELQETQTQSGAKLQ